MKRRMHILASILLSASMLASVAGCGKQEATEADNQSEGTQQTESVADSQETESAPSTEVVTETEEETEVVYEQITSNEDIIDYGGVVMVGDACFEVYKYGDSSAEKYGEIITSLADDLEGVSKVYDIPVPIGGGIVFPDNLRDQVTIYDNNAAIEGILSHMGDNVIGVNAYGTLMEHRTEYVYFRTDHHWTQLGAYYAYTEFCEAKGITPNALDSYKQASYDGFIGSFYFNSTDKAANLKANPDTVHTYAPASDATLHVTASDGSEFDWPIVMDVTDYNPGLKYSCFIAGDNPYSVITNNDITDGSSCIIVKDSFGNAFTPFLVDHYQTVHIIDMRYWTGDVATFAKENDVDDVIMVNNLFSIGSNYLRGKLNGIVK